MLFPNASPIEWAGLVVNLAALLVWYGNLRWIYRRYKTTEHNTILKMLVLMTLLVFAKVAVTSVIFLVIYGIYALAVPVGVRAEIQLGQLVAVLGLIIVDLLALAVGIAVMVIRRRYERLYARGRRAARPKSVDDLAISIATSTSQVEPVADDEHTVKFEEVN